MPLPGLQVDCVGRNAGGKFSGRRIECQRAGAHATIEPFIAQYDIFLVNHASSGNATTLASNAPHFENVGKITAEGERQSQRDSLVAMILNAKPLIGGSMP